MGVLIVARLYLEKYIYNLLLLFSDKPHMIFWFEPFGVIKDETGIEGLTVGERPNEIRLRLRNIYHKILATAH